MSEVSKAEQLVCERLAELLQTHEIGDSLGGLISQGVLFASLEFYLPEVLSEVYREWEVESLDGVYSRVFHKTGEREIELVGLALFVSDQTLTPLHLRLQLSPSVDHVCWMELRLGEHTNAGCRREAYRPFKVHGAMLHVLERLDSIDWFYHVEYGQRDK